MEKQKIADFLRTLCPMNKVEFNNLDITFWFEEALTRKEDIFFIASVENPSKRSSDDDIIFKNYFFMDFDLRQNYYKQTNDIIDDDTLLLSLEYVKEELKKNWFWDYRYIVFTGNWFHIYYVWEWQKFNKEDYKLWVENYFNEVNKIFDDTFKVDVACKNIARLSRLPWTYNYKRSKYWLESKECIILEDTGLFSDKIKNISQVANSEKENKLINKVNYEIKVSMTNINDPVLEEILKIDISDLIYKYAWLELQRDWKNFKSPKDWSNIWMFLMNNVIYITWTHYLSDKAKWYNSFTFVKTHYNLDNNLTFQWFKDNFSNIKDISDKKKQEFKAQQQERNWVWEVIDVDSHFIDFWKLVSIAKENRRKIDWKTLVKYWIKWLDDYLVWILPEELVVIWAQPWVWKSEIAYNIWIHNALNDKKVCLFSLEWNLEESALRYLQKEINKKDSVSSAEYRFNLKDINKLEDSVEINKKLSDNLIVFDKRTMPTLWFLKEVIKRKSKETDLFIIDHLHYIPLEWENENRLVWEVMRELKLITDIYKKPVVLISHLRKPNKMQDEPTEFDFYWSGNISKEATTIILVSKMNYWDHPSYKDFDNFKWDNNWYATRFCVPKSRAWLPMLKIAGAFNKNTKQYIENMWKPLEDSQLQENNRITL